MKRVKLFLTVLLTLCVVLSACSQKNGNQTPLEENDDVEKGSVDVMNTDTEQSEESPDESDEALAEENGETTVEEKTEENETPEEVPVEIPEEAPEEKKQAEPPAEVMPTHTSVEDIKLTIYDVTVNIGQQTMPIVTMLPHNAADKREIWQSSDTKVATVDGIGNIKGIAEGECTVTVTSVDNPEVKATVSVKVIPNPECTYIDGILIANKTYPLPESYAPGWDAEASAQLHVMFAAAKQDGITLFVKSGYRSYIDQKIIYNGYVARDGKEKADTYSARPGHSEHQTGLAFDLNSTANSFADTPEAAWIAANSYKYGFIVRYPKGKEHITGYIFEPWHVRYLGVEKAKEVFDSGLCLEEFLGITSVYSY